VGTRLADSTPTMKKIAIVLLIGATVCCSSSSPSDVAKTPFGGVDPTSGWSGCSGTFDTTPSPTGAYFITDFGCSSSPAFTDTGDNCCPNGVVQASSDGICAAGTTTAGCTSSVGTPAAIACERAVNWFSTGGSAYGMGTRLQLTRPDNGACVVVFVIDNGPACYREKQFGGYALDISYPAVMTLYGEEEGVADRATVSAAVVSSDTPLGPCGSEADAGGGDASTADSGAGEGGGGSGGSGGSGGGGGASKDGGASSDSASSSDASASDGSASDASDDASDGSDNDSSSEDDACCGEDSDSGTEDATDGGTEDSSGSEDAAPLGKAPTRGAWSRLVTWSAGR
jgi:hypothetical protein